MTLNTFKHKKSEVIMAGHLLDKEALNKLCTSMMKRYYTIPKDLATQKALPFDAFLESLMLGMKIVSVNSKHIPLATLG